jgi:hypothetical protein
LCRHRPSAMIAPDGLASRTRAPLLPECRCPVSGLLDRRVRTISFPAVEVGEPTEALLGTYRDRELASPTMRPSSHRPRSLARREFGYDRLPGLAPRDGRALGCPLALALPWRRAGRVERVRRIRSSPWVNGPLPSHARRFVDETTTLYPPYPGTARNTPGFRMVLGANGGYCKRGRIAVRYDPVEFTSHKHSCTLCLQSGHSPVRIRAAPLVVNPAERKTCVPDRLVSAARALGNAQ